jgi:hypothetical protein
MRVVAFDMGQVNFAFCGGRKESTEVIIENMQLQNFLRDETSKRPSPIVLYEKLFAYLDQFSELWEKTDVILIEQQFAKAHATNIKALKLSQHVLAYFMIRYQFSSKGKRKIVEYASSNKTQYYHMKFKKKKDRKQWAVQQVQHHFEMTDPVALDWFSSFHKKDDIADCILMILTYLQVDIPSSSDVDVAETTTPRENT